MARYVIRQGASYDMDGPRRLLVNGEYVATTQITEENGKKWWLIEFKFWIGGKPYEVKAAGRTFLELKKAVQDLKWWTYSNQHLRFTFIPIHAVNPRRIEEE